MAGRCQSVYEQSADPLEQRPSSPTERSYARAGAYEGHVRGRGRRGTRQWRRGGRMVGRDQRRIRRPGGSIRRGRDSAFRILSLPSLPLCLPRAPSSSHPVPQRTSPTAPLPPLQQSCTAKRQVRLFRRRSPPLLHSLDNGSRPRAPTPPKHTVSRSLSQRSPRTSAVRAGARHRWPEAQ